MAHYFINDNTSKREYETSIEFGGRVFRFATSDGVFSKGEVDEGARWLLTAVAPLVKQGRVVDLGCGYGAIGIVLASLALDVTCTMLDANIKAVELANKNAVKNGAEGRAAAVVSDVMAAVGGDNVDVVVTNPPFRAGKQMVHRFFSESYNALCAGGKFYAVLRKQQGAESYIREVERVFGNCEVILKKKGYVVVKGMKAEKER